MTEPTPVLPDGSGVPEKPLPDARPTEGTSVETAIEEAVITEEPFYKPVGNEQKIFLAAFRRRLPLLLKGPTGCGKTRFVEHMAFQVGRSLTRLSRDQETGAVRAEVKDFAAGRHFLVTVPCHEDLTANDLVGRFVLTLKDGAQWVDGPLTRAARAGGICYLDEIVEARKDVTVLLHSLTDHRRILPLIKRGTVVTPPPGFMLVVSFNPGYQSVMKEMKPSTKQRFVSLDFDYPPEPVEVEVVRHEGKCDLTLARNLVAAGRKIRSMKDQGLTEGVSTRLLIYAASLVTEGIPLRDAVLATLVAPLTDEPQMRDSLLDICRGFSLT